MKKKNKKLLLIVSVSVILVLAAVVFAVNSRLKNVVEHEIELLLNKNNNLSYTVHFEKLKLNWLTQSVILKGVTIAPDTILLKENSGIVTSPVFYFNIKALRIRNINVLKAVREKKVEIGEIIVQKPEISLLIRKNKSKKASKAANAGKNGSNFSLDSIALGAINGVSLGQILFDKAKITVYDTISTNVDPLLNLENLSVDLSEITIKKLAPGSIYYKIRIAAYHISGNNHSVNLPGNKYKLSFGSINVDKDEGDIVVNFLKLKPKENIYKLAARQRPSKEVFDIKAERISINGVDIKDIINNRRLFLNGITIDGADVLIVKDKRIPDNPDKRPLFPNQLLYKMDFPLKIDTVLLRNSFLQYSERTKNPKRLMTVKFSGVESEIYNVSSVKSLEPMVIDFKAKLMKKVDCSINISMPLNASGSFSFNGKVGKGNFVDFNGATRAIGLVFKGGRLNGMVFNGKGNSKYAYGKLVMKYRDMNVKIVDNADVKKEKGFLSWAANKILRTNNPVKGKLRENTMYFERIPNKGFPGFLWKTLFSGIKATLIPSIEKSNRKSLENLKGTSKKKSKK